MITVTTNEWEKDIAELVQRPCATSYSAKDFKNGNTKVRRQLRRVNGLKKANLVRPTRRVSTHKISADKETWNKRTTIVALEIRVVLVLFP